MQGDHKAPFWGWRKKGLELGKSDSSKPNKSTKQLDPARGVGNNKTLLNRQL